MGRGNRGAILIVAAAAVPLVVGLTQREQALPLLAEAPRTTVARPASPTTGAPAPAEQPADAAAATDPAPKVVRPKGRPGKPISFSVVATGDILPHKTMLTRLKRTTGAVDVDGTLEDIRPMISGADLAICHIEGALLAPGEAIRPYYILGTPPVWLREVKRAGYDTCSTASNHSLDGGTKGVDATVNAFAEYGMHQSGVATSEETRLPGLLTVKGVKVAHLAYTYGLDHGRLPKGEPWRANLIKAERIIADAREMRARGAEVVIVSMHWGNTQWSKLSPYQEQVGRAITASGQIDLIVGHHSHLLQEISQRNGVWVLWGLSNLLSNHPVNKNWGAATQDGVIVEVTIRRDADGTIVVERPVAHPTWCDKARDYRVRFVQPERRAAGLPAQTVSGLNLSWKRVQRVLGPFLPVAGG